MSVKRMGSTKKYSDNWDKIFGGGTGAGAAKKSTPVPGKKSAKKKSTKAGASSKAVKKPTKKKAR